MTVRQCSVSLIGVFHRDGRTESENESFALHFFSLHAYQDSILVIGCFSFCSTHMG